MLRSGMQVPPFKVVRAFPIANGGAMVHLHNLSGGVLGGDRLELKVDVGPEAYAQITSTGATRVYRNRVNSATAVQRTQVTVDANALLEYLPDPLIPFAGSRYRQETTITLAENAGLFWWETLAPGREAYGEIFAFESFESHFAVTTKGVPVTLERFRLEPQLRPLTSPLRMGPYRYLTTFTICKVGVGAARWLALEAELNTLAQERTCVGRALWAASALPVHGLVMRGLAVRGCDIAPALLQFWSAAKWFLYGTGVVPPRKVY